MNHIQLTDLQEIWYLFTATNYLHVKKKIETGSLFTKENKD